VTEGPPTDKEESDSEIEFPIWNMSEQLRIRVNQLVDGHNFDEQSMRVVRLGLREVRAQLIASERKHIVCIQNP